jgi:hypothetical protein
MRTTAPGYPRVTTSTSAARFAVHYFSRQFVDELAEGLNPIGVRKFHEGELPRRLFCVTQIRPAD